MLSDFFSFYANNFKHSPEYKRGTWDGKIRLYNMRYSTLYYGLIYDLLRYCRDQGLSVELENKDNFRPIAIDTENLKQRLPEITKMDLSGDYQYQWNIVEKALKQNRALILSPTGSGKSCQIHIMINELLEQQDRKILVVVPNVSLTEQLTKDFESYDVQPKNIYHKIFSGQEKTTGKRVVISTYQSIYNLDQEWFEQFGAIIVDEAHGASADSIKGILEKMPDCDYRYGFTGTLNGTKTHLMCLKGLLGKVIQETTTAELMDSGVLSKLEIDMRLFEYEPDECEEVHRLCDDYQSEIKWLLKNQKRNNEIVRLALEQPNNTLVLFNIIKHGKTLKDMFEKESAKYAAKIHYIAGSINVEQREEMRKEVEHSSEPIYYDVYLDDCIIRFPTGSRIKLKNKQIIKIEKINSEHELDDDFIKEIIESKIYLVIPISENKQD